MKTLGYIFIVLAILFCIAGIYGVAVPSSSLGHSGYNTAPLIGSGIALLAIGIFFIAFARLCKSIDTMNEHLENMERTIATLGRHVEDDHQESAGNHR